MAASQSIGEASDNPVGINITAMVDIIFCLCLFFMCSLHFKDLEGKLEAWGPRGHGVKPAPVPCQLEEIRIQMRRDPVSGELVRSIGARRLANDGELSRVVRELADDFRRMGKKDFPVILDALSDVPWQDVVHVLDLCKLDDLKRVEFAQPLPKAQAH